MDTLMTDCPDIARQIFEYIEDDEDLSACTKVCKSWKEALYGERFFWIRRLNNLMTRPIYPVEKCKRDECDCMVCPERVGLCKNCKSWCDPIFCPKIKKYRRSLDRVFGDFVVFYKTKNEDVEAMKNVCLGLSWHMADNADQAWYTVQNNLTVLFSPLHVAAFRNDMEFLKLLLRFNRWVWFGDLPFGGLDMGGICSYNPDDADCHFHAFKKFSGYDPYGYESPLNKAALKGHFENVKLMLNTYRVVGTYLSYSRKFCC